MKEQLTKETALATATRFLTRAFNGDIDTLTEIIVAYADCKFDNDESAVALILNALKDTQSFIQDLVDVIESKDAV